MQRLRYALIGLAIGLAVAATPTLASTLYGGHMIHSGEAAGAKMYTFDDGVARCYIGQYGGTPAGMACTFYTEGK